MNQTSAAIGNSTPSSSLDATALLTTLHLGWIVLFALLVIAGIVYGARVKHRRTVAERQMAEHAAEAGVAPTAAEPTTPPAGTAPPPPPPAATDEAAGDDGAAAAGPVSQLKGLGPKVTARLAELGITTVGQLAALDHDAAARLDAQLGAFSGRMERDRWIEQARFLAAGDIAGFEAVFGRL